MGVTRKTTPPRSFFRRNRDHENFPVDLAPPADPGQGAARVGSSASRMRMAVVSDIHYAAGPEMARRGWERRAIGRPLLRHAAALYRRKMILDIAVEGEFFDTDFFVYREDADVAWRAQLLES